MNVDVRARPAMRVIVLVVTGIDRVAFSFLAYPIIERSVSGNSRLPVDPARGKTSAFFSRISFHGVGRRRSAWVRVVGFRNGSA
ncbi:hypothetical protein HPP92_021083 [Vanilla planifolia]|uniref:Uncharacterized protein n=1 Tax=Vanilla planifolia TaxID=51239 RepID=A0A835UI69_VANPL|nr:hypothetical protein HPP92_021083 [Vanilla planifolia]